MRPSDRPFVCHNWLHSLWSESRWAPRWQSYKGPQNRLIDTLLDRSTCLVACDPTDPDEMAGCIVVEPSTSLAQLHWLFVKTLFRRRGIASQLLEAAGIHRLSAFLVTQPTNWFKGCPQRNIEGKPHISGRPALGQLWPNARTSDLYAWWNR